MQYESSPHGIGASKSAGNPESNLFQPSATDYFFEDDPDRKGVTPLDWRNAAGNGNEWAQCRMGDYYATGSGGFRYDYYEAFKWWLLAAEQGNVVAKYRIIKFHLIEMLEIMCERHHFLHDLFF